MDENLLVQLRAQVAAQHVVLQALIEAHPDRMGPKKQIEEIGSHEHDLRITYSIEDSEIELVRDLVQGYAMLAKP